VEKEYLDLSDTRFGRPGNDLLSRDLSRSTIGPGAFHGRVRNGIGCSHPGIITRSAKACDILFAHGDSRNREPAAMHGQAAQDSSRQTENWFSKVSPSAKRSVASGRRRRPKATDGPRAERKVSTTNESNQADRVISTGKLHALPRFHTRPINVVVYHDSQGRTRFEVGFTLRCLQRLSRPHIATLLCRWRDNRSTRGVSIPVLSY
jgi:hypothetical protein